MTLRLRAEEVGVMMALSVFKISFSVFKKASETRTSGLTFWPRFGSVWVSKI